MSAQTTGKTDELAAVNEVRLVGRVSQEPERRELPSGDTIFTFRVVVPREPTRERPRPPVDALECIVWSGRLKRSVREADTVAAQRALEIRADGVLMAKNGVDGVYTADPRTDPSARKLDEVTYVDALRRGLAVVDAAAFSLCMENALPMVVFGMEGPGGVPAALRGERIGTLVHGGR